MINKRKTVVLSGQKSFDRFRLFRPGGTDLEWRRPTEGGGFSGCIKRDIQTRAPYKDCKTSIMMSLISLILTPHSRRNTVCMEFREAQQRKSLV